MLMWVVGGTPDVSNKPLHDRQRFGNDQVELFSLWVSYFVPGMVPCDALKPARRMETMKMRHHLTSPCAVEKWAGTFLARDGAMI